MRLSNQCEETWLIFHSELKLFLPRVKCILLYLCALTIVVLQEIYYLLSHFPQFLNCSNHIISLFHISFFLSFFNCIWKSKSTNSRKGQREKQTVPANQGWGMGGQDPKTWVEGRHVTNWATQVRPSFSHFW